MMKFTDSKINDINNTLVLKKSANPLNGKAIGIGIHVENGLRGATAFKDNWMICEIDELSRMIEELTMLKESIEEETGLILK